MEERSLADVDDSVSFKIKLQSHNKYKKQFTCCVVLKLLLVVLFPFLNFDDVVSVTSVHVVRSLGEGVVVSV